MSSPDPKRAADRMVWWCTQGNIGYDQSNRWDFRVGGETDCSALILSVLTECGFDVGEATYTGNMEKNLLPRGWKRLDWGVALEKGDILLNRVHHVAMYVGGGKVAQASIDERGKARGGRSGDQTNETNIKSLYNYPWDCVLRYEGIKPAGPAKRINIERIEDGEMKIISRIDDDHAWLLSGLSMVDIDFNEAQALIAAGIEIKRLTASQCYWIMSAVHKAANDTKATMGL